MVAERCHSIFMENLINHFFSFFILFTYLFVKLRNEITNISQEMFWQNLSSI